MSAPRILRAAPLAAWLLLASGCPDDQLTVFDTPPEAAIQNPADGEVIEGAEVAIHFTGAVYDQQDALEELAVVWTTDADPSAPLHEGFADAAGLTEVVTTLPLGIHTVTLQVTDTWGNSETDFITLEIAGEPVGPSTVFIDAPQPSYQYFEHEAVHFAGRVLGPDGEVELEVYWESDLDGALYTGGSTEPGSSGIGLTQFDGYLSEGTHIVTLTAGLDLEEEIGIGDASVVIDVLPEPQGDLDQDGDGFCPDGIDADGDGACDPDELTGPNTQDCNDFDETVCPGCPEVCDGQDNDCDGHTDVNELDQDGDGQSPCGGDCDDADPVNFTGNQEICDGRDNDCDTLVDDDDDSVVGLHTWYADADGDGFGDINISYTQCFQPGGSVGNHADCDDTNINVNPQANEVCDGVDNNCNGNVDEGFDADGDGYTSCDGDCDDTNPTIHPGANEICNTTDEDCDGLVNEDFADNYEMWETGPNDTGYELNSINPSLTLGGGMCDFTVQIIIPFTFNLEPGTASVQGNFHSPDDQWDIYYWDTDLTANAAEWGIFLATGQTLPPQCTTAQIAWNATAPINVTVYADGQPHSGHGVAGVVQFTLSMWDLFDIDYEVVVEPLSPWTNCNNSYTLNFEIP